MYPSKLCILTAATTLACATAALAAATQVNIADPTAASHVAKVEIGNRLAVQEVAPASFFHVGIAAPAGSNCNPMAAPPTGKVLIVRQVRIAVSSQSSSTPYPSIFFYTGSCPGSHGPFGEVMPVTVGGANLVVTWDPGIAVQPGEFFILHNPSSYTVDAYLDGYTVPSGAAPPVGGQTIEFHGNRPAPH